MRARGGWSTWFLVYALLAVAWPATGPLPWLVLDAGDHLAVRATDHEHHAHAAGASHEYDTDYDAADIPGSPTHPLDHDCAQCEVLKHLARCVLPNAVDATVPPAPGEAVLAFVTMQAPPASFIAICPPIRGPPVSSV
jgi:hypothetical protein